MSIFVDSGKTTDDFGVTHGGLCVSDSFCKVCGYRKGIHKYIVYCPDANNLPYRDIKILLVNMFDLEKQLDLKKQSVYPLRKGKVKIISFKIKR